MKQIRIAKIVLGLGGLAFALLGAVYLESNPLKRETVDVTPLELAGRIPGALEVRSPKEFFAVSREQVERMQEPPRR